MSFMIRRQSIPTKSDLAHPNNLTEAQPQTQTNNNIALTRITSQRTREPVATLPDVQSDLSEDSPAPQNAVEQEDVPPNGGYGWVVCLCVFLVNAHTWGINSAWAIFLAHYLRSHTYANATHLEYALIGGLSISQSLVIIPLIAIANRKFGTRITLSIGTSLIFLALLCASFSTQIWHLFLTQGFMFGWGMGFLYVTAASILPQWFSTRRSLANGIATAGAGLGGLAYNLAAGVGVQRLGVPWTYRILAFCSVASNLVCVVLLKDRNKAVKPSRATFNYKEYTRLEVNLIVVWGMLTEFGYIMLLYSLPAYAAAIGLTPQQGAIVSAILNLGLGVGRPVVGWISDRFGRINVATLLTFLCGLFCLTIWIPAKSFGVLLLFALLAGTVCGTFWATVTPVTAEVVGLQRLPSSFGVICFALVLPTTFAEPIALQLVEASGGHFIGSQIFAGVMFLGGAVSALLLRSWKVCEAERKASMEDQAWATGAAATTTRKTATFGETCSELFMFKRLFFFGHV